MKWSKGNEELDTSWRTDKNIVFWKQLENCSLKRAPSTLMLSLNNQGNGGAAAAIAPMGLVPLGTPWNITDCFELNYYNYKYLYNQWFFYSIPGILSNYYQFDMKIIIIILQFLSFIFGEAPTSCLYSDFFHCQS